MDGFDPSIAGLAEPDRPILSVGDLIDRLRADEQLTPRRRNDLASSLRQVAKVLGRDAAYLPAELPSLRAAIARINPAQHGLARQTWANHRSNTLAAFRQYGLMRYRLRLSTPVAPAWQTLLKALSTTPLEKGLSRFIRYCSDQGIDPLEVDDSVMSAFLAYLESDTLVNRPRDLQRRVCHFWNQAADVVPGWPANRVLVPVNSQMRQRLSYGGLPASFADDAERYLAMRGAPDPFDDDAPLKPLKPKTLKLQRNHIRLAADALARRGTAPESVTSLACLIDPEAFKNILRQLMADHDNRPNDWTWAVAKSLVGIAKWSRPPNEARFAELRRLMSRLPSLPPGMKPKNREAMRQFDDEGNLGRLLELPDLLLAEACRVDPPSYRAAVKAQIAFAMRLLLSCPIRGHNLVALRLGEHLQRPAGPKGRIYLCLEPDEVKNDQRIAFELSDGVTRFLDIYLERFQPILGGRDCPWLFATKGGSCKALGTLAQQIEEIIDKHLGLTMHIHQYRHLAGKIHTEANPGNFEGLSQLLHHKSKKSALVYAEYDRRRAGKEHDDIIEQRRHDLAGAARRRAPGRRRGNS